MMKRQFIAFVALMTVMLVFAQNDITTFLGIPVDGTKSELIDKIKKKGFKKTKSDDGILLSGRFNDREVKIDFATNDDKVYRVIVWDAIPSDEGTIKIRYNNLCYQFENNDKYLSDSDWTIPDDEDISYEMGANAKYYQAVFFQRPTEIGDSIAYNQTSAELAFRTLSGELSNLSDEEMENEIRKVYMKNLSKICSNKRVWFTIMERGYDKYIIVMFYENDYNKNNGEDL